MRLSKFPHLTIFQGSEYQHTPSPFKTVIICGNEVVCIICGNEVVCIICGNEVVCIICENFFQPWLCEGIK